MTEAELASRRAVIRRAESPWTILKHDWRSVLSQTWTDSGTDNIGLIAAGTAFWGFAAIAPLLAAIVMSYGLFASSETVAENIGALFGILPRDAANLIADQLATVTGSASSKTGLALAIALGLALYGATQGASAIITALNVAYEEKEERGFLRLYALAFAITSGAVLIALAGMATMAGSAFLGGLLPDAPALVVTAIRLATYAVLGLMAVTGAALLYRFGPDRAHAKWIWLTPGSLCATLLWLLANGGFAFYVSHFGSYGATYGSLSAVIVVQVWLWLSAYIFLLGAELNSQLERRTARDTTTGPPAPPGERGAAVADAVGSDVPSPDVREALGDKA